MKEEKDIELVRWVVRLTETDKGERAKLVAFDKDGSEYTFEYWHSEYQQARQLDITVSSNSEHKEG